MVMKKFELVSQIEYLPGGTAHWQEELEKALAAHANDLKWWAYILHDKDADEETGQLKVPHIHLVLSLRESSNYRTVAAWFGVRPQFVDKIRPRIRKGGRTYVDIGGVLSYLTHWNDKDQYQYDDSEVVAMPGYDWQAERAKSERF